MQWRNLWGAPKVHFKDHQIASCTINQGHVAIAESTPTIGVPLECCDFTPVPEKRWLPLVRWEWSVCVFRKSCWVCEQNFETQIPKISFVNTPRFENKSKKNRYFLVLVKAEKIAVQSCN